MASRLVLLGRVAFGLLMCLQSLSLTSYPAMYCNKGLYGLLGLFLPAFLLWLYIMCKEENLQWLYAVWVLYIWVGLVPLIGTIFGGTDPIEDKIDKKEFPGLSSNLLKMTLCGTPALLLLLLSTGTDSMSYRELIWMLSLRMALDLFDGVEMLEVILDENKIARSFEVAIIVFVCLSFLVSPLQLIEIKLDRFGDWKFRKRTSALRTTIQIICVNGVFLGLRIALSSKFDKDASIFIMKNVIVIILSLFEICSVFRCCGCDD